MHLTKVEPVVHRVQDLDAFVNEVLQLLRQKLFLPPPQIAEYQGLGALINVSLGWLS